MLRAGRTERAPAPRPRDGGYTYVSLLIVLVTIALAAQVAWIPGETVARREKERELIFRGLAYREAIRSYWRAGGDTPSYPPSLGALVSDPRQPGLRHIRELYVSPFDGGWQTLQGEGGGIAGVAPGSADQPYLQSGFPGGLTAPDGAARYQDWQFVFLPEAVLPSGAAAQP